MKDVDWILIHNSSCGNVLVNWARALSRVLKVRSKYQVGLTRDLRLGYDTAILYGWHNTEPCCRSSRSSGTFGIYVSEHHGGRPDSIGNKTT